MNCLPTIDFSLLFFAKTDLNAKGEDLQSDDGLSWQKVNNISSPKIIVRINFDGTICGRIHRLINGQYKDLPISS